MKKIFLYSSLTLMAIGLASCNDFLDENRYPLTAQSDSPDYWNNTDNVDTQVNTFYNIFTGYGVGASTNSGFYFASFSDDQVSGSFEDWLYKNPPSSSSYWSDPFTEIRRADIIIQRLESSTITEAQRLNYIGIARLMRAYEYWWLVKRYGDVQWFSEPVDTEDKETVYGFRDDRDMVMDSVLADLNYACATVLGSGASSTSHTEWSNDVAQAIKSDICLWEGTFCQYRTLSENGKAPDASRAQKFLNACVEASEILINAGYSLCSNYQDGYNSLDLAGNTEMILYKHYADGVMMHSLVDYTNADAIRGLTRDAFEAYLFLDGKPQGVTSYTDESYYVPYIALEYDANGKPINSDYSIKHMLDVRDTRLAQTTDSVLCFDSHRWTRASAAMNSMTGYTIRKFDTDVLPTNDAGRISENRGYTDAPVFWLPVVYCNYAEAKAELGSLTQSDLDNTINKLYARAGLPDLSIGVGFTDPKNALEAGVSDILWEVRRCRRCELMTDNYFRYWDLVRWHMLEKLANSEHPDVGLGCNMDMYMDWANDFVDAATEWNAAHPEDPIDTSILPKTDLNDVHWGLVEDGGHVYLDCHPDQYREWDSKHYLYPIPTTQLSLNPNLTQNPGWGGDEEEE